MIHYVGWLRPQQVISLKHWFLYIWNEYEPWHWGIVWDGIRILGFEFENLMPMREELKERDAQNEL